MRHSVKCFVKVNEDGVYIKLIVYRSVNICDEFIQLSLTWVILMESMLIIVEQVNLVEVSYNVCIQNMLK